jgi:hypothetical protein
MIQTVRKRRLPCRRMRAKKSTQMAREWTKSKRKQHRRRPWLSAPPHRPLPHIRRTRQRRRPRGPFRSQHSFLVLGVSLSYNRTESLLPHASGSGTMRGKKLQQTRPPHKPLWRLEPSIRANMPLRTLDMTIVATEDTTLTHSTPVPTRRRPHQPPRRQRRRSARRRTQLKQQLLPPTTRPTLPTIRQRTLR